MCVHECICVQVDAQHGHVHALDQQRELLHLLLVAEDIFTEYLV